jgi:hypothetical protein
LLTAVVEVAVVVTENSWLGMRALLRSGYRLAHSHTAL